MTSCPVVLCQMQNPIFDAPVIDPVQNFELFDHVSSVASVEVLSDFFSSVFTVHQLTVYHRPVIWTFYLLNLCVR